MPSAPRPPRPSVPALVLAICAAALPAPAPAAADGGSARARSLAAIAAAREWSAALGLAGDEAVPLASPARLGPVAAAPDSLVARTLRLKRQAEAAFGGERWADAAALYTQLAALNPYEQDTWELLGLARHRAGDEPGAIVAFKRAGEAGAGFPFDPPYNIACCEARLGHEAAAMRWLERAFALGYRYLEDLRGDEDLASLRDLPRFRELAATADVTKMSRTAAWRYDLALLAREIRRIHHDPWRVTTRAAFDRAVAALDREIPRLTDPQVAVRMMKIVASIGDAHTRLGPAWGPDDARRVLPVALALFPEGLFVTAADSAHADLAGARVLAFDGQAVDAVIAALGTVIPRDGDLWLRFQAPRWMTQARVLNGLGLTRDPERVTLTVVDAQGARRDVALAADATGPAEDWRSARVRPLAECPPSVRLAARKYAFEPVPGTRTLFVAYNTLIEDPKAPLSAFFAELFAHVDSAGCDRLVIDMRRNGGGNNFLNRPLWQGIVARPVLHRRGHVIVLVGRNTFSAGICSVLQLARHADAVLIGEPTASPPNFTGETIVVNLPYSRLRATISDLYWQNSVAMDYRAWVAPELYVPPTFADFVAGRDLALDAALAWPLE